VDGGGGSWPGIYVVDVVVVMKEMEVEVVEVEVEVHLYPRSSPPPDGVDPYEPVFGPPPVVWPPPLPGIWQYVF
jgi:hypothetical protein